MKIFLNEFIYDQHIHDRLIESIPKKSFKQFNEVLDDLKKKQLLIDWDNLEIFRFLASNILGYLIQHYFIEDDNRIRKLTSLETWRLQGFSDDDYLKAQSVSPESALYKQAGNSISVNVLEDIFKNLYLGGNE